MIFERGRRDGRLLRTMRVQFAPGDIPPASFQRTGQPGQVPENHYGILRDRPAVDSRHFGLLHTSKIHGVVVGLLRRGQILEVSRSPRQLVQENRELRQQLDGLAEILAKIGKTPLRP